MPFTLSRPTFKKSSDGLSWPCYLMQKNGVRWLALFVWWMEALFFKLVSMCVYDWTFRQLLFLFLFSCLLTMSLG